MWGENEYELLRAARKLAAWGDIENAVFLGLTEEDAQKIQALYDLYSYSDCDSNTLAVDLAGLVKLAMRTGIPPHEIKLMGINPDLGD